MNSKKICYDQLYLMNDLVRSVNCFAPNLLNFFLFSIL